MQDYSPGFYSFSHSNVVVDRLKLVHLRTKYSYRILPKNMWKSIANTHTDTANQKYSRYLRQYSKSIAEAISSNKNNAILTTLVGSDWSSKSITAAPCIALADGNDWSDRGMCLSTDLSIVCQWCEWGWVSDGACGWGQLSATCT